MITLQPFPCFFVSTLNLNKTPSSTFYIAQICNFESAIPNVNSVIEQGKLIPKLKSFASSSYIINCCCNKGEGISVAPRKAGFNLFVLITLAFLLNSSLLAQGEAFDLSQFNDDPTSGQLAILSHAHYWLDTDHQSWQQAITKLEDGQFQPISKDSMNFGVTTDVLWLYLPFKRPQEAILQTKGSTKTNEKPEFYLEVLRPKINKIDIHLLANEKLLGKQSFGLSIPPDQLPFFHSNWVYKLDTSLPDEFQLLIRVETKGQILALLTLYKEQSWQKANFTANAFHGIFFGTLLALTLYNLFIFIALRDRSYLYYILSLVCVTGFQLGHNGFGYLFIWGNWTVISDQSGKFFLTGALVFSNLFASHFLRVKHYSPTANQIIVGVAAIAALNLIPGLLFQQKYFVPSISILVVISTFFVLSSCLITLMKGNKSAKVFLLGWGVYLGCVLISLGSFHGIIPSNFTTLHAGQFGVAFESIIFSLALADRINAIQKEKVTLQFEALSNLSQSNKLKDEFLAIISHELRTPMNGVQGSLDLMRLEKPAPTLMSHIETADQSSTEMIRLIDNVLEFSEAQAGNLVVSEESFDLEKSLVEMAAPVKRMCSSRELNFVFSFDSQIPSYVSGERVHTMKVIHHVLENAVKFTGSGTVTLEAFLDEEATEHSNQIWITIAVRDTGMGIDSNNFNQIFSAFKQLDSSFTRKQGGLGLGLATCKQIIEILGGNIRVESELNRGSSFYVSLPYRLAHYDSLDDRAYSVGYSRNIGRFSILVVEDNPVNQKILHALLEKMGYEVFTADNGLEALETLSDNAVDLIFMDCQMPIMDGFEAASAIRMKGPKFQHIPIIAVTANATTADLKKCLDAGMNDTIRKPVKKQQISEKLAQHLTKRQRAQSGS